MYVKIFLENKLEIGRNSMKYQIMTGILFTLLAKRKVSAGDLAAKYGVSVRSIYRYIDEMTVSGIPIDVARGAGGGIYISDAFKLSRGLLTREEYTKTIEAMLAMYEQLHDAALLSAIEKLSSQMKSEKYDLTFSGNILVDSGAWGDEHRFSEKLTLLERAVEEREALDIDYLSREGEHTQRRIYPHLLVYKQNVWYIYAYCTTRNAFRLFKLGRMRAILKTGERFERIPFRREDVPLTFWHDADSAIFALFEIGPDALPFAEDWLGVENITKKDGKYYAEVSLPDDESLVGKILSVGAGFRVLAPDSLRERVSAEAERIAAQGKQEANE